MLEGVDVDLDARCGCSADLSLGVVDRAMFHSDNAYYYYPTAWIRSRRVRTDKVPNTAPTAASSGSDMNGMAALRAARTIRRRLAGLPTRLYQVREADVAFGGGLVRVGAQAIPFERLTRLAFTERVSLSATGYYATPKITWDRDTASGRPFL